ncbi:hypothetical protein FW774_04275 (plasmid) [Pedobacter sp. BS3]|uniref:glycoside hydrolase family 28 protein n=1 Tax=Pedobacter sp. BS3 TaxID=2567937 RepID=UPI0011EFA1B3|nr:glycosyl hydrolase family 28 protein [Pedobacter sp. BS3]TZF86271.1 hypothetical protein FW774_04275 [Pedobacter sp. BS3]
MKKKLILTYLLGSLLVSLKAQEIINIKQFGAVADGKTVNTKAIQKAIDACAQNGGGQVIIPNGVFISGTIKLKDNVALYLEPSAVLKGSPDYKDYEWEPYEVGKNEKRRALISGRNLTNVAILGRGTIDGNGGHKNFQGKNNYGGIGGGVRPFPISISRSTAVKIKDISVINGAFWNMKIDACDDVLIDGITIKSRIVANNDGIDIVDCYNVRIANCNVFSGDDGICLKSNTKRGVKNVTVTNCVVSSESNALKLGAVGRGPFENIVFSNCTVYDTRLSGIAFEIVDGGRADRVIFSNITMHNTNGAIFLKCDTRADAVGTQVKNIIISDIIADGIGKWRADTTIKYHKKEFDERIGMVISGNDQCPIENVTLSNIHLQFAGGAKAGDAQPTMVDKNAHGYPDYYTWGITPAYGINCNYVNGIRFNNIVMDFIAAQDERPAFYFQNSGDVVLDNIQAKTSSSAPSYIRFNTIKGAYITNNKPRFAKIPFCSFEGMAEDVSIVNNDLSGTSVPYILKGKIDEKQITAKNN